MLAEIFMLQLEARARETAANEPAMATSSTRFVPLSPPVQPTVYPVSKSSTPPSQTLRVNE
jgi:hypothetical protein